MKVIKENKRYNNIVIDSNNLFYRAALGGRGDNDSELFDDLIASPIMEFFKRVEGIMEQYGYSQSTTVYLLFDNPNSTFYKRREVDQNYKHRREKTKANKLLLKIINLTKLVASYTSDRYVTLQVDGYEADDLVKPLLESLNIDNYNNCLLISNDLDWARSITDHVHWFDYKIVYDKGVFIDRFKFDPTEKKVILYKAVTGDKSDSIEAGLKNASKDIVEHIVNKYENVKDLVTHANTDPFLSVHWRQKISDSRERLFVNEQMVSFMPLVGDVKDLLRVGRRDESMLRFFYGVLDQSDMVRSCEDKSVDDLFMMMPIVIK